MKYPKINKQPRREVNIPQLSGGLNLRDSLTGIRDNQLTDCVNMWYKDGMLRTRPGFVTNENMKIKTDAVGDTNYVLNINTHRDVRNGDAVLISAICCDGEYGKDGYYWQMGIRFWWQYPNSLDSIDAFIVLKLPDFVWVSEESLFEIVNKWSRFVTAKDGVAYCYASNGEDFYIHKLDYANGDIDWTEIDADDIYTPTVITHCHRTGVHEFKGTQFEGYNLISDKYKMIYSAYNENDSDDKHPMRYAVAHDLPDNYIGDVIAEITIYNGESEDDLVTITHIVHIDGTSPTYEYYEEKGDTRPADGLQFYVKKNYVGFLNWDIVGYQTSICIDTDECKQKYGCMEDNLVLTLPSENDSDAKKKVFCMTQSTWFGGTANGINDGSRLFLCGNIKESEQSLVVWSGLNNPLYFSENNYAYVGGKSQAVTAFGQQGENLMIFKEKSTYYSYYATNDNITADDLINQSVVDYEANSVSFPMIQLNANIGCDCPDTVQLCRNRLVWANSDGNVYTLYSNNQYSERTIYKVSDMISSALSKESDLKNAVSCDFEGHYLLCAENKIYVMDYNSYGYQYASSFSKTEDSNAQIPWYIWEIDNTKYVGKIIEIDNKLMLMNSFQTGDGVTLTFATLSVNEDVCCDQVLICDTATNELKVAENKINSKLQTKLFDFSAGHYLKNVDRVSVGFGNNGGEPINVSFVTDKGCESDTVVLDDAEINEREAAFVTVKNFYPCMRAVRTFGVKIECEGPLVVEGLSLQYRLLGGVK